MLSTMCPAFHFSPQLHHISNAAFSHLHVFRVTLFSFMKLMLSYFRELQENLEDEVLKVPKDQGFVLLLFFVCPRTSFFICGDDCI